MAAETETKPDLSRLIGAIMEHPELIEQISHLADKTATQSEESEKKDAPAVEASARAPMPKAQKTEENQRSKLLYALKPYLSEKRSKAIDSMLTFAEIFDMMKSKKQ